MDDTLRLIRYLYGEDVDGSELERRLAEDDELRREYERLRDVKQSLDRRPSQRPDSEVVDRVVREARTAAVPSSVGGAGSDREPRAPDRSWNRRLQAVTAGLALVLVLGLAWWRLPADPTTSESAPQTAQRAIERAPASSDDATLDDVPAWDDSEELIRIHRNIERLQARSEPSSWGTLQTVDQTRP